MLDVQAVARLQFKRALGLEGSGVQGEDDPEERLEAALERIAKRIEAPRPAEPATAEVAQKLDRIIDTLRDALDK